MNWTPEQEQVITLRDRNLLVSAAAGSGKTAVLVERIIQMITDEEHPVDIDQLLVMTFTNAAAAEMRERILNAIHKKLEEYPFDEHLQLQSALVNHAQITTIDSFCLRLIRDHFNQLEIDPGFRIGDEGELMMLRGEVMEQMLEAHYEQGDARFEQFVDTYASGKADGGIEDYILQVYTFSQSNPWPKQWIDRCLKELEQTTAGHPEETGWMKFLMQDVSQMVGELCSQMETAMEVCEEEGGPAMYLPMLEQDFQMLLQLREAKDYQTLNERLKCVSFGRLAAARGGDIDAEKKAFVTSCRDRVKKTVAGLQEHYGFEDVEEMIADMAASGDVIRILLELTLEFAAGYQEGKRDKNIVDFNDLEHYALDILVKEEDGILCYTELADELSGQFYEILVDEYQDSNYVQEMLIKSLSGERFDRPDVFMVGDVKQSIYRFRLARPELFMEKYETYTTTESKNQKIELHQNFRSRASVLESINDVFYGIMTRNLGNIHYTKEVALHPGAEFEPVEGNAASPTELLLVHTGKELSRQADEEMEDYTSREMEAKLIAGKIRELTDPETGLLIWDKQEKQYRIARHGDMVILLRSISGWTDSFLNVLTQEGIPAYAETGTGYFDTIEVETVLGMLSVIDNPIQDIPLAAVLKSPMVAVNDEELAILTATFKKVIQKSQDRGLYGACRHYLDLPEKMEDPLWKKLQSFWDFLDEMRQEATYLPIHEVIYRVFVKTGYYDYVSAMPAGETRRANLDMLAEKAYVYEQTSYKGLFHFVTYIKKLKKYDTDFGEASVAGDVRHTVRMMSIHKSKGLEFPIVFLAGVGKSFNKQDVRGKILIDADLGIGTDYLNLESRWKVTTLKKNVLKRKMDLDSLGEELRVLYVAMTRAKEKLIMTGTDRYLDKKMERWQQIPWEDGKIPYTVLSSAGSYLDWLLMSLSRPCVRIQVHEVQAEALVGGEVVRQIRRSLSREELLHGDQNVVYDEAFRKELQETLRFQYPYQVDVNLHTKMSVSELKRLGQDVDDKNSLYQPLIPEFLKEEEARKPGQADGASRGTAYHRVLELLDFTAVESRGDVEEELKRMLQSRKLTEGAYGMVESEILWNFLSSPLGQRMKRAQSHGHCHKEQQFVIGIPADQMGLGESEELVLVQGIIDAYLEEDGRLVLIDYKTDFVRPGQEEHLARRYEKQLQYYQRALEQMTGKPVAERILYSLTLQKEVSISEKI